MSRSRFRAALALPVAASLALSAFAVPVATAAETADKSSLVINEVVSNGDPVGDWVELANLNNDLPLDISGWKIRDNSDKAPIVIPAGTQIESGGYKAFYTDTQTIDGSAGFGLGKGDSVRVFDAEDNLVAETTWVDHVLPSWGRVPDKTGEFAATAEATRELANKAATDGQPGAGEPAAPVAKEPWPYDNVYNVDLGGDFAGEDMSGVDFDDKGRAWVVNNGAGKLYALDYDEAAKKYSVAGTWTLKYADGTGKLDTEGVTVGPDGAIYVATERNNEDKKVSRPSVLRFEVKEGEEELKATHEWNLKDVVGEIGANAGLEAISYIPEQKLYAVGVEADGKVHFLDLKDDGTYELKQTYQSPFSGVMALDYRQQDKQLRVLCDEACDGQSILLAHNGTEFAPASEIQARPAHFANLANEGFGSYTSTSECVGGKATETTRFLWADDGVSEGISLRGANHEQTVDCTDSNGDAGSGKGGSSDQAGQTSGQSSTGGVVAAVLGALLAFIAGVISAGPIMQWVKDNSNLDIKLPF
ncbi:lamin tail domain-containing protein [Corynebacterium sp. p3-SID1145]|uniref:lamin tail domain-containing protein n=1 Tax=unclassified Corynebacterium TaxID=2624378 RepID=UPI0021AA1EE4|nr:MULTISPECIES: lamin tail domain-containing protein [unclassified Corynebacterium]MCT1453146.1 lamin tail domain-containing protein [Corynebacterium sp. p3-SID1145]MCT1462257.1 lamin tail domain-containing protein [Corynebacterium sp. p3-SID1140]